MSTKQPQPKGLGIIVDASKQWFLALKTWQKLVVGFVALSIVLAPFSGQSNSNVSDSASPSPSVTSETQPTSTPEPQPSATEAPTQTTILAESGCRNVWEVLGDGSTAALDWSNSTITDDDFVKILQDDVIDDLTAAQFSAETTEVTVWLEKNIVRMKQARVTLIETYNYDRVSNLVVKALTNLSDGMDVYCAGYSQ